ncbi:hypothetical protein PISMIDRAFT_680594 [Pisolithus microcarpus 441]|uniref:Uncharacterized protein n=1 Tax=Pisolithus microcarpus 441 TaxID=765257 RepID=A0A0C9YBH6_9AGAM|nr:hypothetical protein PISMIDRAFT_680594 [Pisolithus microcarpus 441]
MAGKPKHVLGQWSAHTPRQARPCFAEGTKNGARYCKVPDCSRIAPQTHSTLARDAGGYTRVNEDDAMSGSTWYRAQP